MTDDSFTKLSSTPSATSGRSVKETNLRDRVKDTESLSSSSGLDEEKTDPRSSVKLSKIPRNVSKKTKKGKLDKLTAVRKVFQSAQMFLNDDDVQDEAIVLYQRLAVARPLKVIVRQGEKQTHCLRGDLARLAHKVGKPGKGSRRTLRRKIQRVTKAIRQAKGKVEMDSLMTTRNRFTRRLENLDQGK
jgi:uncharacterized protein YicC (UPF0701 family)